MDIMQLLSDVFLHTELPGRRTHELIELSRYIRESGVHREAVLEVVRLHQVVTMEDDRGPDAENTGSATLCRVVRGNRMALRVLEPDMLR